MTRTHKLALLLATSALVPAAAHAQALPEGGTVAAGQASIATPAAGQMAITQRSDRAIINWDSFSIGKDGRVDIFQPGAESALLNRVTGTATSEIAGQLTANGRVFLVNPNGILITAAGSVSAAGFTASTLDIADKDFMAGSDDLTIVTARRTTPEVSVVKGGYAGLLQDRNRSGLLLAKLATVETDGSSTSALDLEGDGFLQVAVPAGGIMVAGRINANQVVLTAGTAQDAARGVVNLSGVIAANGATGHGGSVTLTGAQVNLTGATIDASGASGGGTVTIGGGYQGGGSLAHATDLTVDAASSIRADATGSGDGGSVVLWSDGTTRFAGGIRATGAGGGNGGDAEVSGKGLLDFTGTADLTGAEWGTLLLDPYSVTISSAAADSNQSGFAANGNNSVINATTLTTALGTANVTISTGTGGTQAGYILLATGSPIAWNTGATLTLQAARDVTLNSAVNAAAGGLVVSAGTAANSTATADIAVARFTLASGNWVQNSATLPGFATANFRLPGGSFLRAIGGAGTAANPYQLADIYGVQGMGSLLAQNFKLANDIDASSVATWNTGEGFRPIGTFVGSNSPFSGTFDGAGHVITGLFINKPSVQAGLFGALGGTGVITNVGLIGGSVTGYDVTGALVAANVGGTISNSFATTTVRGEGVVAGGLIGQSNGGTITRSYATGSVTAESVVGGLIGFTDSDDGDDSTNVIVSQSYATGAVTATTGEFQAGGLIGEADRVVLSDVYATGSVQAVGRAGGLFGSINLGSVTRAYASGKVTGGTTGGVAGSARFATIADVQWDINTTGQSNGLGSNEGSNVFRRNGVTMATVSGGLTTAQARTSAAYTGFDFTNTWYQAADLRPILRSEAATAVGGVIAVGNAHQLQLMSINPSASYVLSRDIDLTETQTAVAGGNASGVFGTGGFVPVGTGSTFTGSFDGANHSITNLTINRPTGNGNTRVGLFSQTSAAAALRNVVLVGGAVVGDSNVGGLVGVNGGTITDSRSGVAITSNFTTAGGLAGRNDGTLSRVSATGAVTAGFLGLAGGLVGLNTGDITDAFATGNVYGTSYNTSQLGGLAGQSYGSISRSYATGSVSNISNGSGATDWGGLVGSNDGRLSQVYATGDVSGASSAMGGLAGFNLGTITQAFSSGRVVAPPNDTTNFYVGGFVGTNRGTVSASFWDIGTSTQTNAFAGTSSNTTGATGLTTAQARGGLGNYAGFDAAAWYQAGDMRPILRSEAAAADANGVVAVTNLHQLQLMGANLSGSYRLSNDVDASLTASTAASSGIWGDGGFQSIAGNSNQTSTANPFAGTFDGVGHAINGLTINSAAQIYAGLFGRLGAAGTITNVRLSGGSVTGLQYTGALVGDSSGTVRLVTSSATVTGENAVGGLIGAISAGRVSQSSASGNVTGSGISIGGFAGQNYGTLTQVYATGNVTSTAGQSDSTSVGGLLGLNSGSVTQAYSIGRVRGPSSPFAASGGLIAANNGTVAAGYWDTTTSGQTTSAAGVGRTTAQMQDVTAFRTNFAGFDFDTVWSPPSTGAYSSDGQAHYPELYALSNVVGVTSGGGTRVYGDAAGTLALASYTGVKAGDFVTMLGTFAGNPTTATTDVGTYLGNLGRGAAVTSTAGRSYRTVYVPGTFTVTPATLTVDSLTAAAKTYDGTTTAYGVSLNASGNRNGDAVSALPGAAAFASPNAGIQTLNVSGITLTDNGSGKAMNYVLSSTTFAGTGAITSAPLTVTGARAYDATTAFSTGQLAVTGGVNGETVTLTGGTGSTASANAGSYTGSLANLAVSVSGGQALASNYALPDMGALTIGRATVTVAGATGVNKTYDGTSALRGGASGFTVAGIYAGDSANVSVTATSAAYDSANAGMRAVNVAGLALGGSASGNYVLSGTSVTGSGTIGAALLTYLATPSTRTYGAANPALTGTITGFVNGETQASATTGMLMFGTTATTASNVGNYAVNGFGLTANNGNYVFGQAAGNATALTVGPALLTVAGTRAYDGTTAFATSTLTATGAVNAETVALSAGSGTAGSVNVGSYAGSALSGLAITVTGGNARASNYALPTSGVLSITPRALIVTADPFSRLYGDATAARGTATGDALVAGDSIASVALSTPATAASNVGSYALTASDTLGVGLSNYAIQYAPRANGLTVLVRPVTVTANALSRIYGDANPALTFTTSSLGAGAALTGALAMAATAGSDVGSYAIGQGSVTDANNPNYGLSYTGANLSVAARPITLAGGGIASVYGDAPLSSTDLFAITAGNLVNGDAIGSVGVTTGVTAATDVGSYGYMPGGALFTMGKASNYAIGYTGGSYRVTPATILVAGAAGVNKTYDGTTALPGGASGFSFSGARNGDVLTLGAASAMYDSANAGDRQVRVAGLTLGGAKAGNYVLSSTSVTGSGTISPYLLSVSGRREYDMTTAFATGTLAVSAGVNGETVALTGSGTTAVADVGTYAGSSLANLAIQVTGGQALASNYLLPNTGTLVIDRRAITATTVTADPQSRAYGDANPALTYQATNLMAGMTLNGELATAATLTSSVGRYDITQGSLTNANNPNYDISYIGNVLVVTARPITVTADPLGRTYGDANPALTYAVGGRGLANGDVLAGSPATTATTASGVGRYGITQGTVTNASNPNYAIGYTGADLTVSPRALVVTADALGRLYGDANPARGTATGNNLVNGDTIASAALTTPATATSNVGSYALTGSDAQGSGLANYTIGYATRANGLTVTPRPVTVTADTLARIYGNANPALTYTNTSLGAGAALSGGLTTAATTASGIGAYAIGQGSVTTANNPNYLVGYVGANLTVTPRALLVTPDAISRSYGDANPARGTATGNNLVNGDTIALVALASPASMASNVGSYSLAGSDAMGTGLANYTIGYATLANGLTVTARPITIAADPMARLYGDGNPALTYAVGGRGLVNGDTLIGSLATTAMATSNVGGYLITQGTLAASGNYAVTSYTGATLSVNPRPVTVTADALSRVYGNANPTLTFTTSSLGAGAPVVGNPTTAATTASGVGAYGIAQGSVSNASNPNYLLTYVGANLTVTPRALLVTPDAISRSYGDSNPARGTASAALVNGDTLTSVALASPATVPSGVGGYALTGSDALGTGLTNYTISYATLANGLTILPRSIAVTADALARVYGNANPALTFTVGGRGLVNGDRLSGGLATAATQASPIGAYAITQGSLAASGNYVITGYTGANLAVTQRALLVTADPLSRLYGDVTPARGSASAGLVNGDTIASVALASPATPTSTIGSYALIASDAQGTGLSNYAISYATLASGLAVLARPVTVTADALARIYGNANPALTYTSTSLGAGAALIGSLATAATVTSPVGAYGIGQGTVTTATNPNYVLSYVGADLTITPRALIVTPAATGRIYGDANPARGAATGNNLVNGDTVASVALTTPATVTSGIGSYTLDAADAQGSGLGNYTISYATHTGGFTITARALAIAANPLARVYGDANPALTYTLGGMGLANGDLLTGALTTAATTASNVGGYAIGQGTLVASANYTVTYTGATLTVTPRPLTITADRLARLAGTANAPLTYTLGGRGLVNGDALIGSLATAATLASMPGVYSIMQGSLAAAANYTVTYVPGTLTVGQLFRVDPSLLAGTVERDAFVTDTSPRTEQGLLSKSGESSEATQLGTSTQPVVCPREQVCPTEPGSGPSAK